MKTWETVPDQKYIVVDFQNTLWKSWMAKPGSAPDLCRADGYPTGHVYRFFRTIYKWKRDYGGHLVFCYEGGEKYRYSLFPGYKAGRKREVDFNPAPDVKRLLSLIACTELQPIDAEADDAIAAFIQRKRNASHLILSSDKDLWTLRSPQVQIVSFQEMLSEADVQKSCTKHYGVAAPKSITLAKALYGDKSDGLPSVPRLLKKHLSSLLEQVSTPDELFENIEQLPKLTAQKIKEHESQIRTMWDVVSLRHNVRLRKRERTGDATALHEFIDEFESPSLHSMVDLLASREAPASTRMASLL